MKLTCEQICKLREAVANLKCPNCFSVKVHLCEEEKEENAECKSCGCEFEFRPELMGQWE